jgi:hypothetical protein
VLEEDNLSSLGEILTNLSEYRKTSYSSVPTDALGVTIAILREIATQAA